MGIIIHTKLQLKEKGTGAGLQNVVVQLFDKDLINDDYLGQANPDANGNVSITFDLDKIRSADSPLETTPDLYFKVLKDGKEIFVSEVAEDIDTSAEGEFSVENGKTIDLGSYLIAL